jgi:dihydroflavonol-4-reductase
MKAAFITGSTGFLGLNLIEVLSKGEWEIHALHLPGEDLHYLSQFNVNTVMGNILDYQSLRKSIPERIDVVFHVAGDTSMWNKNNDRQFKINVIGTRNMVKAAIEKEAGRFIHTSSVSAYGYHPDQIISEKTVSNALTCGMNYNITKYQAEQEVKQGVAKGLDAVILNPCNIIGPYDRANWSQIIRAILQGKMQGIPPGTGTFAHVKDVANAHIVASEKGIPGENYILGGTVASFKEIFNEIEKILGKEPSTEILTRTKLKLAMYLFQLKSLIDHKEPMVTPAKFKRLVGTLTCDDSKARQQLSFATVPLRQMLADSYDWLVRENLLSD